MDQPTNTQWHQIPLGQALERLTLHLEAQGNKIVEIAQAQQEDGAALEEILLADHSTIQQLLERSDTEENDGRQQAGGIPGCLQVVGNMGGWQMLEWVLYMEAPLVVYGTLCL